MSAVDIKTCALLIFLLLELGGESDPETSVSCYFFRGQTNAFVETLKFPPSKGKKHCHVCLLESSHIQSSVSEHSPREFKFRSPASNWVMKSESAELNGAKIEKRVNSNSIRARSRERTDCFETRWSLFELGQETWKERRLAPDSLDAGPTGEKEGGVSFKELWRDSFFGLRKVLRGLCVDRVSS